MSQGAAVSWLQMVCDIKASDRQDWWKSLIMPRQRLGAVITAPAQCRRDISKTPDEGGERMREEKENPTKTSICQTCTHACTLGPTRAFSCTRTHVRT